MGWRLALYAARVAAFCGFAVALASEKVVPYLLAGVVFAVTLSVKRTEAGWGLRTTSRGDGGWFDGDGGE